MIIAVPFKDSKPQPLLFTKNSTHKPYYNLRIASPFPLESVEERTFLFIPIIKSVFICVFAKRIGDNRCPKQSYRPPKHPKSMKSPKTTTSK